MSEMQIVGDYDNVLFHVAQTLALKYCEGMTMVEPAIVHFKATKPQSNRRYATINLKLGFANEAFENLNKTVEHLESNNVGIQLYVAVKNDCLSEEGRELSEKANGYLDLIEEKYPTLKKIFDVFIRDWTYEYNRLTKGDSDGQVDTEESSRNS